MAEPRVMLRLLAPIAVVATAPCQAEVYFGLEQVQQALFPEQTLTPRSITLTDEQVKRIEKASGVRVRQRQIQAWQASDGGWMMVDRVLGKHEFIAYALALNAQGAVTGIEIMEYRETYGYQVRDARWRAQFEGKTVTAPLKIDDDIQNVSGATLSCVHVTEGVRRLLATHAAVFTQS